MVSHVLEPIITKLNDHQRPLQGRSGPRPPNEKKFLKMMFFCVKQKIHLFFVEIVMS